MKTVRPHQPSNLPPFTVVCLKSLVDAGIADRISIGGALGLFHYLDYRLTQDVDAWWSEGLTQAEKQEVIDTLQHTLADFGAVSVKVWGDVVSIELTQGNKKVFSFQIAARSARLEDPIPAGWIDVPLDTLADLVASKMVALVERGAPRDFLDIYQICQAGLLSIDECWSLWRKRQALSESDTDQARARLAIESHLERIALHRPLEQIIDPDQHEQARQLRRWFQNDFLQVKDG